MARRLALGALAFLLGGSSIASAQEACRSESVPYDSVRESLLSSLRAIRFQDTASTRYEQVERWLDSLRAKLPPGFAYTRENLARGSFGLTGKRKQSVENMVDAMPGMN